jgi:hypothetical protein
MSSEKETSLLDTKKKVLKWEVPRLIDFSISEALAICQSGSSPNPGNDCTNGFAAGVCKTGTAR